MMNRLTQRERILIYIVAGALFAVANMALLSSLQNRLVRMKAELAQKQTEIKSMKALLTEGEASAARQAWLNANQPRMTNPEQSGVKLLEEIKETARANEVLLESSELGSVETQPAYRSVSVQFNAKCSWENLVKFLHAMQKPERFIVFETASIQVDSSNATKMACKFKVAKWYAL